MQPNSHYYTDNFPQNLVHGGVHQNIFNTVNKLFFFQSGTYTYIPEIVGSQSSLPSCCESQHHHSRAEADLMTCKHHQLAGEPVHSSRA